MAFFGFTLGAAGASGSVATAVAVGAPAVDAEAAGADAGVAGGFVAGAGVVAGAFATGAAGVSVDEVAAAGGVEAGAAVVSPGLRLRRSCRCVFVWHQFAPLFMALNMTIQIRRRREIRPRAPRLPTIAWSRRFQLGANNASTMLPAAAEKSSE